MDKNTGKIVAITGGAVALGVVLYFVLRPKTAIARPAPLTDLQRQMGIRSSDTTASVADQVKKMLEDFKKQQQQKTSGGQGTGGSGGGGGKTGGGRTGQGSDYQEYVDSIYEEYYGSDYSFDYSYGGGYYGSGDYNVSYDYGDIGASDYSLADYGGSYGGSYGDYGYGGY